MGAGYSTDVNTSGIHNYLEEQVPSFLPNARHLLPVQYVRRNRNSAFPFAFPPYFPFDFEQLQCIAHSVSHPSNLQVSRDAGRGSASVPILSSSVLG